jgi:hypothetical protein
MRTGNFLIILILITGCVSHETSNKKSTIQKKGLEFYVPKVNNIVVDGKDDDWKEQGTDCNLYSDCNGNISSDKGFKASFRMAWCDSGFIVNVNVTDDTLNSSSNFNNEIIELFLIDRVGGKNLVQYIINPDFSKRPVRVNVVNWDHRGTRKLTETPMTIQTAACKTDSGYCMEALIPFKNIGISPRAGEEIGFEITVKESGKDKDEPAKVLTWNYLKDTYENNLALNRILLSDSLREKINYNIKSTILDHDSLFITVFLDKNLEGKELIIKDSLKIYMEGRIKSPHIVLPLSMYEISDRPLQIFIDTILIGIIEPDIVNLAFKYQNPYPFEDYIRLLKHKDKMQKLPEHPVLFIGHSQFRYWQTFEEDMRGFTAINRGFGGSKAEHVVHYFSQLVMPYKPKAIVYFEGANDFHTGVPVDRFMESVKVFTKEVHDSLPGTKLFIISPDIRKEHPEYNDKMKKFVDLQSDFIKYIDISDFKEKQGKDYQNLLMPDNTHLNAKGYSVLAPIIREQIKEYMDK